MAKPVQPNDFVSQKRGESVIYEFSWDPWNADLTGRPTSQVRLEILRGASFAVTPLEDQLGYRKSRILVRASTEPGLCRLTRTVTSTTDPPERRVLSFQVLVE